MNVRRLAVLIVTVAFITVASLRPGLPVARRASAQVPNPTFGSNGCAELTPGTLLRVGDVVSGSVTVGTHDPGDDGEGETPTISTSDGKFTSSIPSYNLPTPFSFTVSTDNVHIDVCVTDSDGDEFLSSFSLSVNGKSALTADQKTELNKAAADESALSANDAMYAAAFGLGGVAAVAIFKVATVGEAAGVAALLAGYTSAAHARKAADLTKLALDPPDPNYMVIAQPVVPSLPGQPYAAGGAFTQQEATALNNWLINSEQQIGEMDAAITALNRYAGAQAAGDATWQANQLQAAQNYLGQAAALLNAEPPLDSALETALSAGGATHTITETEAANFVTSVGTNGLPSNLLQVLTALGMDSTDITQVEGLVLVQNPLSILALGGGQFPQTLTDPSVTATEQGVAQVFQSFSTSSPGTPTSGGPSVSYPAGWNLVGGPSGTLEAGALSALYTFQAGDSNYESSMPSTPLQAPRGYWAYFPTPVTITLPGVTAQTTTVTLPANQFIQVGNPTDGLGST